MMHQRIKTTHSHLSNFRPATQDPSDPSTYFVNNSFRSCLQPKRASLDIKLYFQLHKKILRKAIIQQKFQENLYAFENSHLLNRKGFIGNVRHESIHRKTKASCRQKMDKEATQKLTLMYFKTNHQNLRTEPSDEWSWTKTHTASLKPTKLCNHSIYRRKNKSKFEQGQNFSLETPSIEVESPSRLRTKIKTVV